METEPQEQAPRRSARARLFASVTVLATFLLAASGLGVVLAGPLQPGVEAQTVTAEPSATPIALAPEPAVSASPTPATAAADIFTPPSITIEPPPPPPPPPSTTSGHRRASGGTTSPTGAYLTYDVYCRAPEIPYSTGSSDFTALLTLANSERARIGLSSLSWSGSLASSALDWSQAMANADDAVQGDYGAALAHGNLPSPGGQNVAYNYVTSDDVALYGYYSQKESLNVAQSGWVYSYSHCIDMLHPSWTVMGAGGVQSAEGVWYWTEDFQ